MPLVLPVSILETCLSVENLARSRAFYLGLLGGPVLQEDARFCALEVDDRSILILFERGANTQDTVLPFGIIPFHRATGTQHIGFNIPRDSLTAWQERLQQLQIPIERTVHWPKGGTSLYFRDPDNHLLELLTPGVWKDLSEADKSP